MRPNFVRRKGMYTDFVLLDTKKCEACWKCLTVCKNVVLGKINLPWHKHIKIKNANACTGCFKCVNICEINAISKIAKIHS